MVRNGATTIWELWNDDTANSAMNSGNHLMLVDDLTSSIDTCGGLRGRAGLAAGDRNSASAAVKVT
jgi:hypothetical protein